MPMLKYKAAVKLKTAGLKCGEQRRIVQLL